MSRHLEKCGLPLNRATTFSWQSLIRLHLREHSPFVRERSLFVRELRNISVLYIYKRTGKCSERGSWKDAKDGWLHLGS